MGKQGKHSRKEKLLPKALQTYLERAREGNLPSPTKEEEEQLRELWPLICPSEVDAGDGNGNGRRVRGIREPMVIFSYSRREGCWLLRISDKALSLAVTIRVSSPLSCIQEAEQKLRQGDYTTEVITKRLTKLDDLERIIE